MHQRGKGKKWGRLGEENGGRGQGEEGDELAKADRANLNETD